jgi:hypothetical protein
MEVENLIPILYNESEKDYLTDGLGQLTDTGSCIVFEEANGEFSLTLKYPKKGRLIKEFVENRQIYAKPNDIDAPHAFRILEIDKSFRWKMFYYVVKRANNMCEICNSGNKKELTIRKIREDGAFIRTNLRAVCCDCLK